jgi:hypothetical protein
MAIPSAMEILSRFITGFFRERDQAAVVWVRSGFSLRTPASDCGLLGHGWKNQQGVGLCLLLADPSIACCWCLLLTIQSES